MYQYNLYPTLKQKLKNSSIRTLFQKDLKSAPHSRTTLPSPFGGERQSLCAYLGQRQRDLQDAVDGDLAKDIDQVLSCTPEELPDRLYTLAYKPDMLLINIDVFEDLFDAVDILTCLRERHPEIIVLIISAGFLVDDFDHHRITICDAALRPPVTRHKLDAAMDFARDTNQFWNKRLHRMFGSLETSVQPPVS